MISNPRKVYVMDVCDFCGVAKEDVVWIADPYVEDIYDEISMVYLCGDCYGERVDEI